MNLEKISTGYHNETSFNGYNFNLLKSALQKSIRRNLKAKIFHLLFEIDKFFLTADSKSILTNFIHRLQIIFLEDIGPSGIFTLPFVNEHFEDLFNIKEEVMKNMDNSLLFEKRKLIYRELVNYFTASTKSRDPSYYRFMYSTVPILLNDHSNPNIQTILDVFPNLQDQIDWIKIADEEKIESLQFQFPGAFDNEETSFQRYIMKFLQYFIKKDERCIYWAFKLLQIKPVSKYFNKKNSSLAILFYMKLATLEMDGWSKIFDACVNFYNHLEKVQESFLCWLTPLIAYIKEYDLSQVMIIYLDTMDIENAIENVDKNVKIKFDEWDFDQHTLEGKKKGRDGAYFALVSSKVIPEDQNVNKSYYLAYCLNKYLSSGKCVDKFREDFGIEEEITLVQKDNESKYEPIVRAQLITSHNKTDTYFAQYGFKIYFIKGPYKDWTVPDLVYNLNCLKRYFRGVNWIRIEKESLFLNKDIKTYLGVRNRLDKKEKHPFLVMEDLANFSKKIPVMYKESKMWPVTKLVNWDKVEGCHPVQDPNLDDEEIMSGYILAILWRFIIGIGDTCIRNILVQPSTKRVFSVDEEEIDKEFLFKGTKERKNKVVKWVDNNYGQVKKYLDEWRESIEKNKEEVDRLVSFRGSIVEKLDMIDLKKIEEILN